VAGGSHGRGGVAGIGFIRGSPVGLLTVTVGSGTRGRSVGFLGLRLHSLHQSLQTLGRAEHEKYGRLKLKQIFLFFSKRRKENKAEAIFDWKFHSVWLEVAGGCC